VLFSFSEASVVIYGGFLFMLLGRLFYIPWGDAPPVLKIAGIRSVDVNSVVKTVLNHSNFDRAAMVRRNSSYDHSPAADRLLVHVRGLPDRRHCDIFIVLQDSRTQTSGKILWIINAVQDPKLAIISWVQLVDLQLLDN
jgi:hypothetical protein